MSAEHFVSRLADGDHRNTIGGETAPYWARCSLPSLTMVHYFFHLKADSRLIEDDEGSELETAEEARKVAIKSLREIFAASVTAGAHEPVIDGILIADGSGDELAFLSLAEILPKWLQAQMS